MNSVFRSPARLPAPAEAHRGPCVAPPSEKRYSLSRRETPEGGWPIRPIGLACDPVATWRRAASSAYRSAAARRAPIGQCGELIERIAASTPVGKLLLVEPLGSKWVTLLRGRRRAIPFLLVRSGCAGYRLSGSCRNPGRTQSSDRATAPAFEVRRGFRCPRDTGSGLSGRSQPQPSAEEGREPAFPGEESLGAFRRRVIPEAVDLGRCAGTDAFAHGFEDQPFRDPPEIPLRACERIVQPPASSPPRKRGPRVSD